MNAKSQKLIKQLKKSTGEISFFQEVKTFFENQYPSLICFIIKAIPFHPFYTYLTDSEKESTLIKDLVECKNIHSNNDFLKYDKYDIYKLENVNQNEIILLVLANLVEKNQNEIKNTCEIINDLYITARHQYNSAWKESSLLNANLISQMSHDINSMINLLTSANNKFENNTNEKIEYTEKMAKDVLQYVRDIEILDIEVNVFDLLNSILDKIKIPNHIEIVKDYKLNKGLIEIDVELIDKVIREIIMNSINALGNNPGTITISAEIYNPSNIFFQTDYLKVCVEDSGSGINPDFLEFLTNPFFTTRKSEFHSGLGLSIANKIIDAHSGHLDIQLNENMNLVVTIYLPVQRKNDV